MANYKLLRFSSVLLFVGSILLYVGEYFHSQIGPGILPNDHAAVFLAYAAAGNWTAIHFVLFAATAIFIAGLIVLFLALNIPDGISRSIGIVAVISAGVTLAIYAMDAAVDGVALKQAALAWVNAPAAEQAARFASVESIRWLEWGAKSYAPMMLGLTLLLFAVFIVSTARIPAPIGLLVGLYGIAYIWNGWVVGSQGFYPPALQIPVMSAPVINVVMIVWLLIIAWRRRMAVQPARA